MAPLLATLVLAALSPLAPSDHGDTPLLDAIARPDAKLTDLHVFTRGDRLVLALSTNPAIPTSATSYVFPTDVVFAVRVDVDSAVTFTNATDLEVYGGTIAAPKAVREDVVFRVRFDDQNQPVLTVSGIPGSQVNGQVQLFAGLRDDPFIRGPRIGRNVAAIVIELPLDLVLGPQSTLLAWATASIEGRPEPFQDLAGRSLRSMFLPNDFMNTATPRQHFTHFGAVPDVTIYDTSLPAAYPNGRELVDDVVDLVGHPGTLATDAPFPSENDVPFLAVFPYLAPPH